MATGEVVRITRTGEAVEFKVFFDWYDHHDLFFRYEALCASLQPPEVK